MIDNEVPGGLHEIIAERNTLYVAPGDYLLLPGSGTPSDGIEQVEKELGAEVVLAQGITEPWVIRKAVPAQPAEQRCGNQCPYADVACTLPDGHLGVHYANGDDAYHHWS